MIPNVLTVAGVDPSGGAGIAADLKTFSALGVYGMSVVTALTVQNTQGVSAVQSVPAPFVAAQLDALLADSEMAAIKIGMLAEESVTKAVADCLRRQPPPYLVLDTVMVAKGGHKLLQESAVDALRSLLVPMASLVTPNLPEAAALLHTEPAQNEQDMVAQGRALIAQGAKAVLLKGGHLLSEKNESPDLFVTAQHEIRFSAPRVPTKNTHGTGCSLSAALAALRPQCKDWPETIARAKDWLSQALQNADRLSVGKGIGPVHHFHRFW